MKGEDQFKKEERLKSKKVIDSLFKTGRSFGVYPLRLVWNSLDEGPAAFPVQVSISVPKRKFPKAVDRNRIRRQVREAWRLNKSRLYDQLPAQQTPFAFMIIYTGREALPYSDIEKATRKMIKWFLSSL